VKAFLLQKFEAWKQDVAPTFWLHRRAQVAKVETATSLVDVSVPIAEAAIQGSNPIAPIDLSLGKPFDFS
jgi:hypothetical protein